MGALSQALEIIFEEITRKKKSFSTYKTRFLFFGPPPTSKPPIFLIFYSFKTI
jgi:hypothetical protein